MEIKYIVSGDQALLMEFGRAISPEISQKIRGVMKALEEQELSKKLGIRELLPTYRSILILFDPLKTDPKTLENELEKILPSINSGMQGKGRTVLIPTCYGGEMGPDLAFVAENAGMSQEEIIERHSKPDYLVYMLGFTPGFTYLGGLDPKIATPRLASPRVRIPAGSVGIADQQTGIYPIDSPGGWQLIGRTPLALYRPDMDPPVLLQAGDYIRFVPIDLETYRDIEEELSRDEYQVEIIEDLQEDLE